MDTVQLIIARRSEVEQELERLRERISHLEGELTDLLTTQRVLSGLPGAKYSLVPANKPKPKGALEAQAAGAPTIPVMIYTVLEEAYRTGKPHGLEPREIADAIDAKGWGPINRDVVRTRVWRLARDKKLLKDAGTSRYLLIERPTEKASDLLSREDQSEALGQSPAQGGEARPGGGT